MTRYAVLLRAVNVGGNNKVPMATWRDLAADLGYTDVSTYVQSGNLVCTAPTARPAEVERAFHDALHDELGLDLDVTVRSRKELAAVMKANPLSAIADDDAKLLVTFLAGEPAAAKLEALDRNEFDPARFEFGDRCIYQWFPAGVGRSKLATVPWEKRIGVRGTGRNWRTITKLLDLLDGV